MQKITELKGKRRALTTFFLGVLATLALPPFFILPLLAISVCGWFLLIHHAPTRKQAMWDGWWWGLGFFMSGLYWMCISLLVDAEKFAWMIPFCLIGLNGIIALYPMLASALYWSLSRKTQLPMIHATILFASCWSITEFWRSVLFTGFPWNLVGYSWAVWTPAMQSASIIGIQGLTLVTMLLAISPLWICPFSLWEKAGMRALTPPSPRGRGNNIAFICLWAVWCMVIVWGILRIPDETAVTDTRIRMVQAAIPQSLKWDPNERIAGIRKHLQLSRQMANENTPDIIIWPESAVPLALNQEPALISELARLAPAKGAVITGSIRIDQEKYYNSIYAITKRGISTYYNKHHLVPFGEFVPLRHILPLDKITPGNTDFSRGVGPVSLEVGNLPPFTPLVCYEAIFSSDIHSAPNTKWMLNLTNDAWFGNSTGPYQHFHMTRFRAVEFGMPLVRGANTGISAIVDPYGRVIHSLGLNESGVLDGTLPAADKPTVFQAFGNFFYFLFLGLGMVICLGRKRPKTQMPI